MVKKESLEKEKLEENRLITEPIDLPQEKLEEVFEKIEGKDEEVSEVQDAERFVRRMSKEEKEKAALQESLARWKPKTKLGKMVKNGKIKSVDEIFEKGLNILESEIVDTLLPNLKTDLILIGQAKGKFGGGKRRFWKQTQKKTAEGNVPHFTCMVIVGDGAGHVGVGLGKAKETLPAKGKALRNAKLNIASIKRGCGSFDCTCADKHSIPFKTEGKISSSSVKLFPAAKGTGLVAEKECKKILALAGVEDVYTRTFGQSRTKINLIGACFLALKQTLKTKK